MALPVMSQVLESMLVAEGRYELFKNLFDEFEFTTTEMEALNKVFQRFL